MAMLVIEMLVSCKTPNWRDWTPLTAGSSHQNTQIDIASWKQLFWGQSAFCIAILYSYTEGDRNGYPSQVHDWNIALNLT
ncbi:MAG: hypothetical protein F6K30_11055 [Cyanothece sp. SIO2G6]|nr:hypothetical protein [Cyanothece sp. SIO2G6]